MPTEIPILPEAMGTSTLTPVPGRSKAPEQVELAQVKGQWAVLVEGRIVTRTPLLEVAQEYARRVKAGDVTAQIPQEIPKSWARFAPERN